MDEMRISYRKMTAILSEEQQTDLHNFREMLGGQNNVELENPSYSLVEASKTNSFAKAVFKYLQQKLGFQYPFEIAKNLNRGKLSDDYSRLLLQPCKTLVDIWGSSIKLFLLKRYQPDVIEMVKSEREMYNALITGQVCFYLLEFTESIFDKSFSYMIRQKKKSEIWFANIFNKKKMV